MIGAPRGALAMRLALLACAGCAAGSSGSELTQVELTIAASDALPSPLTQVELLVAEHAPRVLPHEPRTLARREVVVLLLPDEQAGKPLELQVWGRRGGERIAYGTTVVTPARGTITKAEVELLPYRCDAGACTIDAGTVAEPMPTEPMPEPDAGSEPPAGSGCEGKEDGEPCEAPPDPAACYAATGACEQEVCVHAFADGAECDDGDACTVGDRCEDGTCNGTECEVPPPECIDDNTLREYDAGACNSTSCPEPSYRDVPCPGGCRDDACLCVVGPWSTTRVDDDAMPTGTGSAIAVHAGIVHVVYGGGDGDELRHAYKPGGGTWTPEWVATGSIGGSDVALAIDASGTAHVAYDILTAAQIWYGTRTGDTWETDLLVSPAYRPALVADPEDGVHLSYFDSSVGDLIHAYRSGGATAFDDDIADPGGNVGDHSALAVDAAGGVHIIYRDVPAGDLLYIFRPSEGSSFDPIPIATAGDVGYHSALAVHGDADDVTVHVAYYDPQADDLYYAFKTAAALNFTRLPVDTDGDVGQYPAIGVDREGTVHIAYRAGSELRHAMRLPGGDFQLRPIDSRGMGLFRTAMTVDDQRTVHVSYYDDTAGALWYASFPVCD